MGTRLVLALSVVVGIAGMGAATAADVPYHMAMHDNYGGQRAVPMVIESYQPGVTMREYWLSPWHNRHYYPFSHKRFRRVHKEVHRRYRRFQPARTFHRVWSNGAAFSGDCAPQDRHRLSLPPQRGGDRSSLAFEPSNS